MSIMESLLETMLADETVEAGTFGKKVAVVLAGGIQIPGELARSTYAGLYVVRTEIMDPRTGKSLGVMTDSYIDPQHVIMVQRATDKPRITPISLDISKIKV